MLKFFALFFLTAGAFAAPNTAPVPLEQLRKFQSCHDTANCIRVDNGCCDCANGGGTVAINRKHEKEFAQLFDCKKTMCTQRAGDCKFREPVCKDGLCALGPQKQLFPKKK